MSIFSDGFLRTTSKSKIYDLFQAVVNDINPNECVFVVDEIISYNIHLKQFFSICMFQTNIREKLSFNFRRTMR